MRFRFNSRGFIMPYQRIVSSVEEIEEVFVRPFPHSETRQVISGISAYYPDTSVLVGKQVPVVINLEPRLIKGYESNGMVLYAIEEKDGKENLTTLEPNSTLENGSIVR